MTSKQLIPVTRQNIATRRDIDNPVLSLWRDTDSLFDSFFGGLGYEPLAVGFMDFNPTIDVTESDKEIRVLAELPGMDEKDINVSLYRDTLMITGEKRAESEQKGKDYHHVERTYGSFSRTIQLPAEAATTKITAELKKGVLTIVLPKSARAAESTRKVKIKVA
jgi:HSP20 family protein